MKRIPSELIGHVHTEYCKSLNSLICFSIGVKQNFKSIVCIGLKFNMHLLCCCTISGLLDD